MIRHVQRWLVLGLVKIEREWKQVFHGQKCVLFLTIMSCVLLFSLCPARAQTLDGSIPSTVTPTPAPAASAAPADKKTDTSDQSKQKIVNNPFMPGGVTTADQTLTRKEVMELMNAQEERLRKEMTGPGVNTDDLSKLVANAAAAQPTHPPDNFMGCVNGVPIYRQNDGSLDLGTKDPEPLRQERCGP